MKKVGQTPAETVVYNNVYKNHVIRINQQSDVLLRMVNEGIRARITNPEVKTAVQNFKNIAVRYTDAVNRNVQKTEILPLFNNLLKYYDQIIKNYIDKRYEPLKQIRTSLLYLWQKNYTGNQAAPPTQPPPAIAFYKKIEIFKKLSQNLDEDVVVNLPDGPVTISKKRKEYTDSLALKIGIGRGAFNYPEDFANWTNDETRYFFYKSKENEPDLEPVTIPVLDHFGEIVQEETFILSNIKKIIDSFFDKKLNMTLEQLNKLRESDDWGPVEEDYFKLKLAPNNLLQISSELNQKEMEIYEEIMNQNIPEFARLNNLPCPYSLYHLFRALQSWKMDNNLNINEGSWRNIVAAIFNKLIPVECRPKDDSTLDDEIENILNQPSSGKLLN